MRTGVRVDGLTRVDGRFVVTAAGHRFEAENVIVATGAHRIPKLPDFAAELDPRIVQLHSHDYRSPSQLQEGDVLVVGAGNSGAEIAMELARTHRVSLAGPSTGQIPVPHGTLAVTARVPGLPVPRSSRAEGGHRDRPEGRAEARCTREIR